MLEIGRIREMALDWKQLRLGLSENGVILTIVVITLAAHSAMLQSRLSFLGATSLTSNEAHVTTPTPEGNIRVVWQTGNPTEPAIRMNIPTSMLPPVGRPGDDTRFIATQQKTAASSSANYRLKAYPTKFYTFDEVDQAAVPVDDWRIDMDMAEMKAVSSLIVTIRISATGEVLEAVVDESPLPNADDRVRKKIVEGLKSTRTLPAYISGAPVASERTMELIFDRP
jgi:hypothetical protein